MKTAKIFATLAIAALALNTSAQLRNDPEGYTRLQFSFVPGKFSFEMDNALENNIEIKTKGGSIAYIKGISLTDKMPLFLELGGRLTFTHGKDKESYDDFSSEYKVSLMDIAIPCNVAYKFAFDSNDIEIIPFVGPNFKFNIVGIYKSSETEDGKTYKQKSSFFNEDDMKAIGGEKSKRFQMGMNLGVGFRFGGVYLGYQIQPDFSAYAKFNDESYETKCKTFNQHVTLGFFL